MRTTARLTTALGLLAAGVVAAAPSASADDENPPHHEVVVIGDSYASGEGAGNYDPDTDNPDNQCHRSYDNWAMKTTMPDVGVPNSDVPDSVWVTTHACSGATSDSILTDGQYGEVAQLDGEGLSETTSEVYLSVGGNDVGFSDVIKGCTIELDCSQGSAIDDALAKIPEAQEKWNEIIDRVHEEAPNATIYWMGYPQLMQGSSDTSIACAPINPNEAAAIDGASVQLDDAQGVVAMDAQNRGVDVQYVDPSDYFANRGACSADPAINGYRARAQSGNIASESFHPNLAGTDLYAEALSDAMAE